MLGEAFELLRALERAGTELPSFQRGIATPGRSGPCLRVRLDREGAITAVEPATADDWPSWTHLDGNQNSLPVIRLTEPGAGPDDRAALAPLLDARGNAGSRLWGRLGFAEGALRR